MAAIPALIGGLAGIGSGVATLATPIAATAGATAAVPALFSATGMQAVGSIAGGLGSMATQAMPKPLPEPKPQAGIGAAQMMAQSPKHSVVGPPSGLPPAGANLTDYLDKFKEQRGQ